MGDLLAGVTDPLARSQFRPGHFTVGAFVVADGHMLLVHHRRLGIWLEPGGHIDPEDATLEAAAARELIEETGVVGTLDGDGIFDLDVHPIPAGKGEPPHHHFNVGFHFTAEKAAPVASAEVKDARWVALDEVADLNTDYALRRASAKLQRLEAGG